MPLASQTPDWAMLPVTPLWQFWVSLTPCGKNGVGALRSSMKGNARRKKKTSKKNSAFNLVCQHLSVSFLRFGGDREERGMKKSASALAPETAPLYLFGGAVLRGTRM